MNAALVRRGPDSEGCFVGEGVGLAMRRLAIIDLAGGEQPVSTEDGAVVAVCNGEIYNYRELRAGLVAGGRRLRGEGLRRREASARSQSVGTPLTRQASR